MTNRSDIMGVILAAGKGSRIYPFGDRYPKSMLPICNKPLIHYQIELMKQLDIKEIVIVVGHLKEDIIDYLKDGSSFGVNIKYIDQRERLGLAHAVVQIENYIDRPFVLLLGDIYCIYKEAKSILNIFKKCNDGAVLAVKEVKNVEAIKKNFAVILDKNDLVKRVIEKPRYTLSRLKGCGLYLFSLNIFDAIRRTPKTAYRDEYEITDSIQILINDGFPVKVAKIIKEDINLTFPCDLLNCNLLQLKRLNKNKHIGLNTKVRKNTKIINSVIGNNVVINHPITIRDSLIFPDVKIINRENILGRVVTQEYEIRCPEREREDLR